MNTNLKLGLCYFRGDGVEQDYDKAITYFRKGTEEGDAESQYYLGVCYKNGMGIEKNLDKALKCFITAANQGLAIAQNELGMYYLQHNLQKQEAVKWLYKAAQQGDVMAQSNLGIMYSQGDGVDKNIPEAMKWFREAAYQGHAKSQYNYAMLLLADKFCNTQKRLEASTMLVLAANQGFEPAKVLVSTLTGE